MEFTHDEMEAARMQSTSLAQLSAPRPFISNLIRIGVDVLSAEAHELIKEQPEKMEGPETSGWKGSGFQNMTTKCHVLY